MLSANKRMLCLITTRRRPAEISNTPERGPTVADTHRLPEPLVAYWEWQNKAACRGMDSSTFYHPIDERNAAREKRIKAAQAICGRCPVIDECLNHALRVREPYGIWG